jgi:hypothetical protein
MRRLTISGCVLFVMAFAAWAMARPPVPLDRPTPPPCAADGICYPNVNEWGVYETRWRRWPGQELVPTPAKPTPAERLGTELPPFETPSPEHEDEQAPPASTKKPAAAPTAEPTGEAPNPEGFETPTVPTTPTAPASPSTPSYEPSPLTPPAGPTTDLDPPPAPPFATSVVIQSGSTAPSPVPTRMRPDTVGPLRQSDPPPAAPWAFRSASL